MNTNSCLVILAVTGLALSAHAQQDSQYPLSIFWYPQQMTNRNQMGYGQGDRPYKLVQAMNTNVGGASFGRVYPTGAGGGAVGPIMAFVAGHGCPNQ